MTLGTSGLNLMETGYNIFGAFVCFLLFFVCPRTLHVNVLGTLNRTVPWHAILFGFLLHSMEEMSPDWNHGTNAS